MLQASLAFASTNSRLHQSWQTAVSELDTKDLPLSDRDLELIKKYKNLQKLTLRSYKQIANSLPVWLAVASLGGALTRLNVLHLRGTGVFDSLKAMVGTETLRRRMRELHLADPMYIITTADLRGLAAFTSMRSLQLEARNLHGSAGSLQHAAVQLRFLQELTLIASDLPPADALAAFPGALNTLTSLNLSLRCIGICRSPEAVTQQHQEHQACIISAVSALGNLQQLSTNLALLDAAAQRAALSALASLTSLQLSYWQQGEQQHKFVLLQALPNLRHLHAPRFTIPADDALTHPELAQLEARSLDLPDTWRGKTAHSCHVTSLHLHWCHSHDDSHLRALPTLPRLRALRLGTCADIHRTAGRYLYLASLLHRHARSLETLDLGLHEPFLELLPVELPALTWLQLTGDAAVSRDSLGLLAMCRLPALRELLLMGWQEGDGDVEGEEVEWLGELPALGRVRLRGEQGVVEGALQGTGVVVECY